MLSCNKKEAFMSSENECLLQPAYVGVREDVFEPALAALIALLIVLFVGCVSVIVVCCCFRHWSVLLLCFVVCSVISIYQVK
jgi:hypothetical protein